MLLSALGGGVVGWFAREVISGELRRKLDRIGRQGVIEGESGIFPVESTTPVRIGLYPGINQLTDFEDWAPLRIVYEFELFNDSRTPVIYKDPRLEVHGVEGLRRRYSNPTVMTAEHGAGEWSKAASMTVPPHGTVRVRCLCPLPMDLADAERELIDDFAGTVAQIDLERIDGKRRKYRVSTRSFLGGNAVVWPKERRYPIYNQYSLNDRGRNAGRTPQRRKPELDSGPVVFPPD